ncbi:unnamed protein product [Bursaphelenchus xylophilus]|uniref:(pine wood nematode) hypothetical protein n=1 Tax=Bursaphelenchus xylophilus TaxID=6326 RepID=A0A811M3A8_BURXY|nr:unnamed protein product [Bursaphelenchus xylophilus]CAG9128965.1 unnamed protein product [Bursaphelenchus xylophilus]
MSINSCLSFFHGRRRNCSLEYELAEKFIGEYSFHTMLNLPCEKVLHDAFLTGVLNLNQRQLKEFPTDALAGNDISDLIKADISSNCISQLPITICELRSLETLEFRSNALRTIPPAISSMVSLTYLDLSDNHLTELPDALFTLPLRVLLLSRNRLQTLSVEIRHLAPTIEEIDLSANKIRVLPNGLSALTELRVLNLRGNQLKDLPADIGTMSLKSLDLANNMLIRLPAELYRLGGCVEFNVDGNPLIEPPMNVVRRGRAHIFKWLSTKMDETRPNHGLMEKMLNGDHALTASCAAFGLPNSYGMDFSRANTLNATIRRSDRGSTQRNIDQKRIERRSRSTRLTTTVRCGPFNGTDSGYISTGDDLREQLESINLGLSELNASTRTLCYVDETDVNSNDTSVHGGDLAKEIMKTYEQNMVGSINNIYSSSKPPTHSASLMDLSNNNLTKPAHIKPRPTNVVPPLSRDKSHNGISSTTLNTVLSPVEETTEKSAEITTKPPTLHLHKNITANGNADPAKTSSTTPDAHSTVPKPNSAPSRPTDSATKASRNGTAKENGTIAQNGQEKPKIGNVRAPVRSGSTSTGTKLPSSRPSTLSTASRSRMGSSVNVSQLSNGTKPASTTSTTSSRISSRSSSTMSLAPTKREAVKVVRKTTAPRGAKVQPVGSKVGVKTIPTDSPDSAKDVNANNAKPPFQKAQSMDRIDLMRKTIQKHLETEKLEIQKEKLANQLADGVILCNFVNVLFPKSVPTVAKAVGSLTVAPTRARRNIENFITIARSQGVSETSLCTVTDILERKNLQNTAKTVLALAKLVEKNV